jgi:hypothetical protein
MTWAICLSQRNEATVKSFNRARCIFPATRSSSVHIQKENQMAEVHTTIKSDASGNSLKFDNPSVTPLPPGAGQTIVQVKDAGGKVISSIGQVPGSSVVHSNPA